MMTNLNICMVVPPGHIHILVISTPLRPFHRPHPFPLSPPTEACLPIWYSIQNPIYALFQSVGTPTYHQTIIQATIHHRQVSVHLPLRPSIPPHLVILMAKFHVLRQNHLRYYRGFSSKEKTTIDGHYNCFLETSTFLTGHP
jgi:hypothetical protein